jgi:hypothetical protein
VALVNAGDTCHLGVPNSLVKLAVVEQEQSGSLIHKEIKTRQDVRLELRLSTTGAVEVMQ